MSTALSCSVGFSSRAVWFASHGNIGGPHHAALAAQGEEGEQAHASLDITQHGLALHCALWCCMAYAFQVLFGTHDAAAEPAAHTHPALPREKSACCTLLQASNRELEHEKQRMDVLLARQYNLISCMAQQSGLSSNAHGMNSLEQRTLGVWVHPWHITAQLSNLLRMIGVTE